MGYASYLKELLTPLGVYNLEDGAGAAEIEALGVILDMLDDTTNTLEKESTAVNASSYGLTNYEDILQYRPVYSDTNGRRNAIISLLQIDDASFTKDALNKTISGCGLTAEVRETENKYVVEVRFPGTLGIPENMEQINQRLLQILPCHIDVVYTYTYTQWNMVEGLGTWNEIESRLMTWSNMESYNG